MLWFAWLLPIIAGGLDASSRVVIKKTEVNKFLLAGFGFLFATPWYALWLWYQGMPLSIEREFWFAIAGVVPLGIIAGLLTVEAHRTSPFVLTAPYLSLTPAFLLITAPLMGGGNPTIIGILGVCIIVIGVYALNCSKDNVGLLMPFRLLFRERGSIYMIITAFIYSISTNLDLIGLQHANASLYLLTNHGLTGFSILLVGAFWFRKENIHTSFLAFRKSYIAFVLFGAFIGVQLILHFQAFEWIPIVPYVISAKRIGTVLLTVSAGIFLALWGREKERHKRERDDIWYRIFGIFLMLGGMLLVIVFGE